MTYKKILTYGLMIGVLSAAPIYAQQKDCFGYKKGLEKQVVKDNNITNKSGIVFEFYFSEDSAKAAVAMYKKQGGKLNRTQDSYEFNNNRWHCKKTIIIDDYVDYLKKKGKEADEWMQDFLAGNKNEEIKDAIVNSLRETKRDYSAAWQFYKKLLFNGSEEDVTIQEVKPKKKGLFTDKW